MNQVTHKTTQGDVEKEKAASVAKMFGGIAKRYDLLNHLLSFGIDIWWRKEAVRELGADRENVLDIACGTGDLSIAVAEANREVKVVGADFVDEMVDIAKEKVLEKGMGDQIELEQGDAMSLLYSDETFDGVTCAFGVRNFSNVERGIKEMVRVMRKDGRMVILEFTQPKNRLFGAIYKTYFTKVLPAIGGLISGSKSAYEYLPDSVGMFPTPERFSSILEESGLVNVTYRPLAPGVCGLYSGVKP